MKIQNFYSPFLEKISKSVTQSNIKTADFCKKYILVWPKVIFYDCPLILNHIRHLFIIKEIVSPELKTINQLFKRVLISSEVGLNHFRRFNELLEHFAVKSHTLDPAQVASYLKTQKIKISKISAFFSEIMLKSPLVSFDEESDTISEIAVTVKFLNTLLDDLASRNGMFSTGKERSTSDTLAAEAQAVFVPEERPRFSPLDIDGSLFPSSGEAKASAVMLESPIVNKASVSVKKPPIAFANLDPIFEEFDEIEFIKKFEQFEDSANKKTSNLVLKILQFVIYDIFYSLFKFIFFELPHGISSIQNSLKNGISEAKSYAVLLVQFKKILAHMDRFSAHLVALEPVMAGLELFIKSSHDESTCLPHLESMLDQLYGFSESTESKHVVVIIEELQQMVSKVNPLLKKTLDSLHGRSLLAVMTPNPIKLKKAPSTASVTVPGSAASVKSGDRSSSSSEEVQEGTARVKSPNGLENFFVKLSKGFQDLTQAPAGLGLKKNDSV